MPIYIRPLLSRVRYVSASRDVQRSARIGHRRPRARRAATSTTSCPSLWTTTAGLDDCRAVSADYTYELRRGEEIVATGRLLLEDDVSLGDELTLAGFRARVEELAWAAGESRLVLSAAELAD